MKLIRYVPHIVVLFAVLGAVFNFTAHSESVPDSARRAEAVASTPDPGVRESDPNSSGGESDAGNPGSTRRVRILRACSGSSRTFSSVDVGQAYMKRSQAEDGSWSAGPNARTGPAVTGLALLSFLGAGETHKHGNYKKTVKNGLRRLKQIQDPAGCFGDAADADHAANHAIATLAMCEAYGMTGSPLFKQSAQQAINYITRERRPATSVALWEMMALCSARLAGLRVPEFTKSDALEWLNRATDRRTGVASCASGGVMPATVAGQTAAAVLCRIFNGEDPNKSELIQAAAKYLVERRPGTKTAKGDVGLVYFGTLAMFQCGGDAWKKWNRALKEHEIGTQIRSGEHAGTWNPEGRTGELLGRPGTTALRTMNLQVYYRYGRVFGTKR